jgi:hypothetical protein
VDLTLGVLVDTQTLNIHNGAATSAATKQSGVAAMLAALLLLMYSSCSAKTLRLLLVDAQSARGV